MKTKALLFALVIAAATALSYATISDSNADYAIRKADIKIPGQGQSQQ